MNLFVLHNLLSNYQSEPVYLSMKMNPYLIFIMHIVILLLIYSTQCSFQNLMRRIMMIFEIKIIIDSLIVIFSLLACLFIIYRFGRYFSFFDECLMIKPIMLSFIVIYSLKLSVFVLVSIWLMLVI